MKSLTKIIIISSGGVLVCLLLYVVAINPLLGNLYELDSTSLTKKQELATLEQQIRAFKTAQSDLSKATRKDEINSAIVPKESLVLAVVDIESAAAKTGTVELMHIDDAKPINSVITGHVGVDEVTYNIQATNDFAGTLSFLSHLEHIPRFTEITFLSFASAGEGKITTGIKGVFFIKTPKP